MALLFEPELRHHHGIAYPTLNQPYLETHFIFHGCTPGSFRCKAYSQWTALQIMEGSFDLTGGRANHCELYDELSSELRFANLQNSFRRVEFFEATLLGF